MTEISGMWVELEIILSSQATKIRKQSGFFPLPYVDFKCQWKSGNQKWAHERRKQEALRERGREDERTHVTWEWEGKYWRQKGRCWDGGRERREWGMGGSEKYLKMTQTRNHKHCKVIESKINWKHSNCTTDKHGPLVQMAAGRFGFARSQEQNVWELQCGLFYLRGS